MAKGQGALVGATYGLLLRAETEKKKPQEKEKRKDRVRERDPMTDRALKLPRLSFSLSLTGAMLSLCFFFFSYLRGHKKKQTRWKRKKKRARSQRTGSSRSTDCVRPDTQQALKKKKKRTALGKKKKGTLRRLRDERGGIGLSVFTRGPQKSHDLKDLTPRPTLPTHTHTQITPSPHPAG